MVHERSQLGPRSRFLCGGLHGSFFHQLESGASRDVSGLANATVVLVEGLLYAMRSPASASRCERPRQRRAHAQVITIREMTDRELDRIGEVDRSEHVTHEYVHRGRALERRSVDMEVPDWSRSGSHEHSVQGRAEAWRPILERGGTLVGAFDGSTLVGFAIYRPGLAESLANLAALYVSRGHRRGGIGARLVDEVVRLARADGARRLYVSATPSGATVEFYRSRGFEPTAEPNAELFALEPDDIHMIRAL